MLTQAPYKSLPLRTMIDQQLWFLGHDIRHTDGNALPRFGFDRMRSPDGGGTSCYRLPLGDGSDEHLVVWGFALYLGRVLDRAAVGGDSTGERGRAGVLLFRPRASAQLVHSVLHLPLHKPSDLPRLAKPTNAVERDQLVRGVVRLALVMRGYESWARANLGQAHRSAVLRALPRHKRRTFASATDLADAWGDIEATYEGLAQSE